MSGARDELADELVLRRRLERHLARSGSAVQIRHTPLGAVVRRAGLRRRRQRAAGVLGATCLVVASIAGVVAGSNDDRTIVNVDEPPTVATEATAPPSSTISGVVSTLPTTTSIPVDGSAIAPIETVLSSIGESSYDWRAVTPDDASRSAMEVMVSSSYNDRGTLGWTYNESSPPDWVSTVFVSDDGAAWRNVPTSPGLSVVGGIETVGGIHVVGYAGIGQPDAGKVFVATSADRGRTWRRDPLPFDLGPAWETESISVRLFPSQMAALGDMLVVAIEPTAWLDLSRIGVDLFATGHAYTAEGIALLRSCDGCPTGGPLAEYDEADVERVITWDELGMSAQHVEYLTAKPLLYLSGPGGFTAMDIPFEMHPNGTSLTSSSSSILAIEQRHDIPDIGLLTAPGRLYETTDGRTWRLVGDVPLQSGRSGRIGGRYVVAGPDLETGDLAIASSVDGAIWTIHPLPADPSGAVWSPSEYAIDDTTFAVVAVEMLAPPELRMSKSGVTMIFDAGLNDMQFIDDATGVEIGGSRAGENYGPLRLDEGPGDGNRTLSVLDDAGNVRAGFSLQEVTAVMQSTAGPMPRTAVYTTDDLTTWSRTVLTDVVVDGDLWVTGIDVVDDQVILRATTDRDGDPLTFESDHVLVIGTRTR